MANRCELTDKGALAGNNVSHSHRKTRRRFNPNIQKVTVHSDTLGQGVSLKLAASTIRTIDHNGGLDQYLVNTSSLKLTPEGQRLKKKIKKALENKAA